MQQKTIMDHSFGAVPVSKMPRSVFNRSWTHTTSFDCDYLIPIFLDQGILPGDTVSCKFNILTRMLSASLKPIMDNLYGTVYTFFVPDRVIWANARKHFGEQDSPADSISYNIPYINTPNGAAGGIPIGHLYDYFGLPTEAAGVGGAGAGAQSLANLAGRAYNKIWHDHFKDQNLQNDITIDTGDGPDTWANYNLLKIGKKFDYFTSCLPYPQKGATAVSMPLGTQAPIKTNATDLVTGVQSTIAFRRTDNGAYPAQNQLGIGSGTGSMYVNGTAFAGPVMSVYPSNLYADLSGATAATINSLRQSITLQQFLERDARSGTRIGEIIKSHFAGVVIPDFRIQRSEIIHIFNFDVRVNSVAQTSASGLTGGATYLGDLSGFGSGVSSGDHYVHSFTEWGVLMSLLVIRGEIKYSQGIDRFWRKSSRYDRYWPILANLGEQPVLNEEIYSNLADGTAANQKSGVFGYLPRYDEYRHSKNLLTGLMRPQATGTLAIWNLAELFSAQPTLGATFIQSNTPLDRNVAVPSAPHFIVDALFDVKHARIMPVYSVPGLTRL